MDDLKTCIVCGGTFPRTKEFFYANKGQKDGLLPRCKDCLIKGRKPRVNVPEGHKRCARCEGIFPVTSFYSGKGAYCIPCARIVNVERYALVKEQGPKEAPPPTMICNECGQEKAATPKYFPAQANCQYGLRKTCKECEAPYRKQWAKGEKRKQWSRENYRTRRIGYFLNRYETQRTMILARQRNFKSAYPEIVMEWKHKYAHSFRGKLNLRKSSRNHIALRYKAQGNYTPEDIQSIFAQQEGKCAYCKKQLTAYHIDHVVPLSRGGTNWPDNLALACATCNCSKGAKLLSEWLPNRH